MSSCHNSIAEYPALPAISIFFRIGTGRIVLEFRQYKKSGMLLLPGDVSNFAYQPTRHDKATQLIAGPE
jgi:hypothetical protein